MIIRHSPDRRRLRATELKSASDNKFIIIAQVVVLHVPAWVYFLAGSPVR